MLSKEISLPRLSHETQHVPILGHQRMTTGPLATTILGSYPASAGEVVDLRSEHLTEAEARECLSTLAVVRLEKEGTFEYSARMLANGWDKTKHMEQSGMREHDAAAKVRELQESNARPVNDRINALPAILQRQIQIARERLEARDTDGRYQHRLIEFDSQLRQISTQSLRYAESKKKGKYYLAGLPHGSRSKHPKYERIAVVLFFKRRPRPTESATSMLRQLSTEYGMQPATTRSLMNTFAPNLRLLSEVASPNPQQQIGHRRQSARPNKDVSARTLGPRSENYGVTRVSDEPNVRAWGVRPQVVEVDDCASSSRSSYESIVFDNDDWPAAHGGFRSPESSIESDTRVGYSEAHRLNGCRGDGGEQSGYRNSLPSQPIRSNIQDNSHHQGDLRSAGGPIFTDNECNRSRFRPGQEEHEFDPRREDRFMQSKDRGRSPPRLVIRQPVSHPWSRGRSTNQTRDCGTSRLSSPLSRLSIGEAVQDRGRGRGCVDDRRHDDMRYGNSQHHRGPNCSQSPVGRPYHAEEPCARASGWSEPEAEQYMRVRHFTPDRDIGNPFMPSRGRSSHRELYGDI